MQTNIYKPFHFDLYWFKIFDNEIDRYTFIL